MKNHLCILALTFHLFASLPAGSEAPADEDVAGQNNWIVYNRDNSGLHDNYISSIAIDNSGKKWIGTGDGLVVFDDADWTVYNSSTSGLPFTSIWTVNIDESGNKWIGTQSAGLAVFDDTNFTVFNSLKTGFQNSIHSIVTDGSGKTWVSFANQLSRQSGVVAIEDTTWTFYWGPDFMEDVPYRTYYRCEVQVLLHVTGRAGSWDVLHALYQMQSDSPILRIQEAEGDGVFLTPAGDGGRVPFESGGFSEAAKKQMMKLLRLNP